MVITRNYTAIIGTRGGAATGQHQMSGFNAIDVNVLVQKLDAGTTGQIFAENYYLKPFTYINHLRNVDVPDAFYAFPPPDTGVTLHETMSGLAMTAIGAGSQSGNAGDSRYGGFFGMLTPTSGAEWVPGFSSLVPIAAAENAGLSWGYDFNIFRTNTVGGWVLLERNPGTTVFVGIFISSTGAIQIINNVGTKYTSAYTLPLNTWVHIGVIYNATAATIQIVVNGVAQTAVAYTRVAYGATVTTVTLNYNQLNNHYIALIAGYYNKLLTADDYSRHWNDLYVASNPGNFVSTPASVGIHTIYGVVFSNAMTPGYDAASGTLRLPLTPIISVVTTGGVYQLDVTTREYESGDT